MQHILESLLFSMLKRHEVHKGTEGKKQLKVGGAQPHPTLSTIASPSSASFSPASSH